MSRWKLITEDSLPKIGDEVGAWYDVPENPSAFEVDVVEEYMSVGDDDVPIEGMTKEAWDELGWQYHRALNVPERK